MVDDCANIGYGVFVFPVTDTDCSDFMNLVQAIVHGRLQRSTTQHVYLVKLDNWFHFKWRGFTCKYEGVLGVRHPT